MIFAGVLVLLGFGAGHSKPSGAASAGSSTRPPDGRAFDSQPPTRLPSVVLTTQGFASWALLDRATGELVGSDNLDEPGDTMSTAKAWLAADYLRQSAGSPDRNTLARLSIMIRDSDNAAADHFYKVNGADAGMQRMIAICGLTDSHGVQRLWSNTVVSARDVARLGLCLADGRAAGPVWTDWLLAEMRAVRGEGDFGPRLAFPKQQAAGIAIKNGWLLRDEDKLWHITCLAVSEQWTLGVLLRYPAKLGFGYGTKQCRSVAQQLFPSPSPPA